MYFEGAVKMVLQADDEIKVNWSPNGSAYYIHSGSVRRIDEKNHDVELITAGGIVGIENCLGVVRSYFTPLCVC